MLECVLSDAPRRHDLGYRRSITQTAPASVCMHANVRGSHHFNFHEIYQATRLAEHQWHDPVAEELTGVRVPGLESLITGGSRRYGGGCGRDGGRTERRGRRPHGQWKTVVKQSQWRAGWTGPGLGRREAPRGGGWWKPKAGTGARTRIAG